jgi:hypothetical protein
MPGSLYGLSFSDGCPYETVGLNWLQLPSSVTAWHAGSPGRLMQTGQEENISLIRWKNPLSLFAGLGLKFGLL